MYRKFFKINDIQVSTYKFTAYIIKGKCAFICMYMRCGNIMYCLQKGTTGNGECYYNIFIVHRVHKNREDPFNKYYSFYYQPTGKLSKVEVYYEHSAHKMFDDVIQPYHIGSQQFGWVFIYYHNVVNQLNNNAVRWFNNTVTQCLPYNYRSPIYELPADIMIKCHEHIFVKEILANIEQEDM